MPNWTHSTRPRQQLPEPSPKNDDPFPYSPLPPMHRNVEQARTFNPPVWAIIVQKFGFKGVKY
jgi:hypothetical protein